MMGCVCVEFTLFIIPYVALGRYGVKVIGIRIGSLL
jgi:hypothetical protein